MKKRLISHCTLDEGGVATIDYSVIATLIAYSILGAVSLIGRSRNDTSTVLKYGFP